MAHSKVEIAIFTAFSLVFCHDAAIAGDLYVSSSGSDLADGSIATPWQTVAHAAAAAAAGDTIHLAAGDYGAVVIAATAALGTSGAKIKFEGGAGVYFDTLTFSKSASPRAYHYVFRDIEIRREYEAGGTCTGFTKCGALISIGAQNSDITISGGSVHGYTTDSGYPCSVAGVYFTGNSISNILFDGVDFHTINSGIVMYGAVSVPGTNIQIKNSSFHDMMGSAIATVPGLSLIENTVVMDEIPQYYYAAHAGGSGLAMRGGGITIKNVLVRNYGMTRPVMWYQDVAGPDGYSDVLIENLSVEYSVDSVGGYSYNKYAQFTEVGSNFTIKNSTFTGGAIFFFADNEDGSGLSLYNNLFSSLTINNEYAASKTLTARDYATSTADLDNINEDRNIYGNLITSGCGYQCTLSALDPTSGSVKTTGFADLFVSASQPDIDYRLADNSLARNFGVASFQSSSSLGQLNGFFLGDGPVRGESAHSSGAYEFSSRRLFRNVRLHTEEGP